MDKAVLLAFHHIRYLSFYDLPCWPMNTTHNGVFAKVVDTGKIES